MCVLRAQLLAHVEAQQVAHDLAQVGVERGQHLVVGRGDDGEVEPRVRLHEALRVTGRPCVLTPRQQRVQLHEVLLRTPLGRQSRTPRSPASARISATWRGSASAKRRCITPASSLVATTYVPEPCRMSSSPL